MFAVFSGILKSGKAIVVVAVAVALLLTGWYIHGLQTENEELRQRASRLQDANQELSQRLIRESEKHQEEVDALSKSLDTYMSSLALAAQTSDILTQELEREAAEDEDLDRCLNQSLPSSAYDRLYQ